MPSVPISGFRSKSFSVICKLQGCGSAESAPPPSAGLRERGRRLGAHCSGRIVRGGRDSLSGQLVGAVSRGGAGDLEPKCFCRSAHFRPICFWSARFRPVCLWSAHCRSLCFRPVRCRIRREGRCEGSRRGGCRATGCRRARSPTGRDRRSASPRRRNPP